MRMSLHALEDFNLFHCKCKQINPLMAGGNKTGHLE